MTAAPAGRCYLLDPGELDALLPDEPGYRADQLRAWLYRTPVVTADEMSNLPTGLRSRLEGELWPFALESEQVSELDATVKWLFRAPDGAALETVLMGYPKRTTLCVSSQAGCALGCTFCATGQFGFERHLEAGEIVAQLAWANARLRASPLAGSPDHVTNLVFMGMGEPLANYDRVREAIRRMIEVGGMSARAITVSTVGMVPGMRRLADEPWPVNLAVSVHAADDDLRDRLVPINRRYPLSEVEAAAAHYFARKGRRISIEWTMIDGVNDGLDQAVRLAPIARRLHAHVNLIAMNPTPLTASMPSPADRIAAFAARLEEEGVNVTVRDTRGRDIHAACGQLRTRELVALPKSAKTR